MQKHTAPGSGTPPAAPPKLPRRHKKRPLPWTKTSWRIWFICAMGLSIWMTVNMPSGMGRGQTAVRQNAAVTQETDRTPRHTPGVAGDMTGRGNASSGMGHRREGGEKPAAEAGEKAPGGTDGGMAAGAGHAKHGHTPKTALGKLEARALMFGRLFFFVALGALLGGIIEGRCWYMALAATLGRITRAAKLPNIVGLAMPTALASGPAADSMLVAGLNEGEIRASAVIAGGCANSFLAYLSHSIRTMYPVIAAIGMAGVFFYAIQITGGLLAVLGIFAWNRWHVSRLEKKEGYASGSGTAAKEQGSAARVLPWKETLKKSAVRALALLFRLACISVPLILAMEWLIRCGALDFWDRIVPEAVNHYFPEQLLTIIAAQLGGLVQSSFVSAGLLDQGLITKPQILLAMLTASAVSNPFRTLRRNLPTALAIFPLPIALTIVIGMQIARLLTTVCGIALVIFWMRYQI